MPLRPFEPFQTALYTAFASFLACSDRHHSAFNHRLASITDPQQRLTGLRAFIHRREMDLFAELDAESKAMAEAKFHPGQSNFELYSTLASISTSKESHQKLCAMLESFNAGDIAEIVKRVVSSRILKSASKVQLGPSWP